MTTSTVVVSVPFDAIRGFVIAVYDMKWYLACVLATYPDSRELQVSFLHPGGPARSYHYPTVPDIILIDSRDVLRIVEPTTATGRAYSLSHTDTELADQAMQQMK